MTVITIRQVPYKNAIWKTQLADNPRTLALHKFMHESVLYNLERMRTKGDSKQ